MLDVESILRTDGVGAVFAKCRMDGGPECLQFMSRLAVGVAKEALDAYERALPGMPLRTGFERAREGSPVPACIDQSIRAAVRSRNARAYLAARAVEDACTILRGVTDPSSLAWYAESALIRTGAALGWEGTEREDRIIIWWNNSHYGHGA